MGLIISATKMTGGFNFSSSLLKIYKSMGTLDPSVETPQLQMFSLKERLLGAIDSTVAGSLLQWMLYTSIDGPGYCSSSLLLECFL